MKIGNTPKPRRICGGASVIRAGPVSRVLSCAAIYLRLPSPAGSSVIHGLPRAGSPVRERPKLASDGVYMARIVTNPSVSSCLAFPPLPSRAVYFCCTFLEVAFT